MATPPSCEARLFEELIQFHQRLAAAQKDLPAEAARVLRDNLWQLYDGQPDSGGSPMNPQESRIIHLAFNDQLRRHGKLEPQPCIGWPCEWCAALAKLVDVGLPVSQESVGEPYNARAARVYAPGDLVTFIARSAAPAAAEGLRCRCGHGPDSHGNDGTGACGQSGCRRSGGCVKFARRD